MLSIVVVVVSGGGGGDVVVADVVFIARRYLAWAEDPILRTASCV